MFSDLIDTFCQWCSGGFVDNSLRDETIFQVVSDEEGVTRFVESFPLSCLCVQACIAHRRKLESRLFHLQQAYHSLQDEVDYLRQLHGPGSALTSIQGKSDAILVAAYIGGRVWRRFYGPLGTWRSVRAGLVRSCAGSLWLPERLPPSTPPIFGKLRYNYETFSRSLPCPCFSQ